MPGDDLRRILVVSGRVEFVLVPLNQRLSISYVCKAVVKLYICVLKDFGENGVDFSGIF
ncbi:hypothetical protein [Desulfurobacterium sp.]